ncbi:MAG: hypothetical protein ACYTEZ_01465 [Planctomycetota bacterium]|jgi:hypothetical protein
MGGSRLVPRGLIGLLLVAACAPSDEDLLVTGDMEKVVYSGGGGGSRYGPSTLDPGVRGAIRGKVSYKGRVLPRRPLDLTTQDGFCDQANAPRGGLFREDFLVGSNGELGGVIVYVKKGLGTQKWDVPAEPVVLDQIKCQYIPHVAVIQTGQPLLVKSSDNTNHNVHGAPGPNDEFNHPMSRPGELAPKTFKKPEIAKRIYCDVHGWMESWLAIMPHPFHAISGEDGTFAIENVPPGTYLLAAWHEELGEIEIADLVVKASETVTREITFER